MTVVTGFLGSGKTTLVNHLLAGARANRVAALVNDFGALDIDAALVSSVADEVVQLTNGCVCCTINGDLYAAAERTLALEPRVERIVVETTGLADPLPVGLTFLNTELRSRTSLEAVVTVVDCANFALDLFAGTAASAQIVHGDVIVLNKTDLVEPAQVESLEERIAVLKPRARTLRAQHGRVPLEVVLDSRTDASALRDAGGQAAHGDDGFASEAFALDGPLSSERFQAWLDDGLPAGVFRAKGLLRFDRAQGLFAFQLCGARAAFDRCDPELEPEPMRLVFIGRDLDRDRLAEQLDACRAG